MDVSGARVYQFGREFFGQLRDLFVREDGITRLSLVLLINLWSLI